jgi:hypothetical protein
VGSSKFLAEERVLAIFLQRPADLAACMPIALGEHPGAGGLAGTWEPFDENQ